MLSSESPFFLNFTYLLISLAPLVLSLFIFKGFCILILGKRIHVRHTLPSLPLKFKQMAEMPADLTTDEECDESSMRDNDYDFNDA